MNLLTVRNLSVTYHRGGILGGILGSRAANRLDAVIDANFSLDRAATLAIAGESGSGKSSLVSAIMGLVPVSTGTVTFMDHVVAAPGVLPGKLFRREAAMMFQDPLSSLSPRRRVGQLIAEPFAIHGEGVAPDGTEVRSLLETVGLPAQFALRYPHELSGGQARRVGVARAIALKPRLIIADEPTAGLDVSVQGEVLNLIRRLQRDAGISFIIITHNLAVVRQTSDRLAVLYMGRIVEAGPTDTLLERPAHPYTAALLASQPGAATGLRAETPPLSGEVASLIDRPRGCEFHPRCRFAREDCKTGSIPVLHRIGAKEVRCHHPIPSPENSEQSSP